MCKILPSGIFLNPRWPPKLNRISILTITSDVLVVELQFFFVFPTTRSDIKDVYLQLNYFTIPKRVLSKNDINVENG